MVVQNRFMHNLDVYLEIKQDSCKIPINTILRKPCYPGSARRNSRILSRCEAARQSGAVLMRLLCVSRARERVRALEGRGDAAP